MNISSSVRGGGLSRQHGPSGIIHKHTQMHTGTYKDINADCPPPPLNTQPSHSYPYRHAKFLFTRQYFLALTDFIYMHLQYTHTHTHSYQGVLADTYGHTLSEGTYGNTFPCSWWMAGLQWEEIALLWEIGSLLSFFPSYLCAITDMSFLAVFWYTNA